MSASRDYQTRDACALSVFDDTDAPWIDGAITHETSAGYCRDAHREGLRLLATQPHSYINDEAWGTIAIEDQLTRTGYRLLVVLIALCEPGNYIYSNARIVSRHMGVGYRTCLDAWNELRAYGYLSQELNEWQRVVCWRLNPSLAWRGRPWKAEHASIQFEAQHDLIALAQEHD